MQAQGQRGSTAVRIRNWEHMHAFQRCPTLKYQEQQIHRSSRLELQNLCLGSFKYGQEAINTSHLFHSNLKWADFDSTIYWQRQPDWVSLIALVHESLPQTETLDKIKHTCLRAKVQSLLSWGLTLFCCFQAPTASCKVSESLWEQGPVCSRALMTRQPSWSSMTLDRDVLAACHSPTN